MSSGFRATNGPALVLGLELHGLVHQPAYTPTTVMLLFYSTYGEQGEQPAFFILWAPCSLNPGLSSPSPTDFSSKLTVRQSSGGGGHVYLLLRGLSRSYSPNANGSSDQVFFCLDMMMLYFPTSVLSCMVIYKVIYKGHILLT